MNIYVDFDDCLCESGRHFSRLAAELFGKNVPYEDMRDFDLQKSFSLTDEQFMRLMAEGHRPEELLAYEETPGASGIGPARRDCCRDSAGGLRQIRVPLGTTTGSFSLPVRTVRAENLTSLSTMQ